MFSISNQQPSVIESHVTIGPQAGLHRAMWTIVAPNFDSVRTRPSVVENKQLGSEKSTDDIVQKLNNYCAILCAARRRGFYF